MNEEWSTLKKLIWLRGKILAGGGGGLPDGYTRLKGFSFNNDCYFKIEGFKLSGSDTLRFAFSATDGCNVIGAYSGSASGNNYSLYVGASSNYLRYKNGAYNSAVDFDTRYDVEITPTGSSGMKTNSTWTEKVFETPTDFCIGTTSENASSAKLKGNLYGDVVVEGRFNGVPVRRESDSALGYYDTVRGKFWLPATGTPTSLGDADMLWELADGGLEQGMIHSETGAEKASNNCVRTGSIEIPQNATIKIDVTVTGATTPYFRVFGYSSYGTYYYDSRYKMSGSQITINDPDVATIRVVFAKNSSAGYNITPSDVTAATVRLVEAQ